MFSRLMPLWLKPSYIVIGVLVALLGVQTWRLSGAKLETAHLETAGATLMAEIAKQRADGVLEGVQRQKAASDKLEAQHREIIAGLKEDKATLQKHYDATYLLLKQFAAQEEWSCLEKPLPEYVLEKLR
jgi:hypothetical protein